MLFSREWWITAVVAGVAASVLGSYIVRWLDRGGGSAVRWIATITRRRRMARAFRIAAARVDERAMNRLRRAAILQRLDGVGLLVFALIVAGFKTPVLRELMSFGAMTLGVILMIQGTSRGEEADEAEEAEQPPRSN